MEHTNTYRRPAMITSGNAAVVGLIVTVAILANIAGYLFNLYDQWGWFDKVLHAYTLFAITLVVGIWMYGRVFTGVQRHAALLVLLITSVGAGIGAWWEVAEWVFDQLVAGNVIQGKRDTITDVIVDTVGAVVAGVVVVTMLHANKPTSDGQGEASTVSPR